MPPATRTEIADCLAGAFSTGPSTRDGLLATAGGAGARSEVLRVLERLPQRPFYELRDLWNSIPDVPIDHDGGRPGLATTR